MLVTTAETDRAEMRVTALAITTMPRAGRSPHVADHPSRPEIHDHAEDRQNRRSEDPDEGPELLSALATAESPRDGILDPGGDLQTRSQPSDAMEMSRHARYGGDVEERLARPAASEGLPRSTPLDS